MALINKALLHPKEFNVDELKLQFDKEDEEIELKKQEWAEVRKKMATERRLVHSIASIWCVLFVGVEEISIRIFDSLTFGAFLLGFKLTI